MNQLVLLTGASSGIGLEMARILAAKHYDLIITARSEDKLQALKQELEQKHPVQVLVMPADLAQVEQAKVLYQAVKATGRRVDILINNAGVGAYGAFEQSDLEAELKMIELNICSLVTLTKLFLPDMRRQGNGAILNMASLLSYFPFPYFSVYAATKAFVLSFSEALRAELKGSNISVTAVCPGPTDSNFANAEMATTNAYSLLPIDDPKKIAAMTIKQLLRRRGKAILGFPNQMIVLMTRFSPSAINAAIFKFMASQRR